MFGKHKIHDGHVKPSRFDRDLIVIGAGSGGLVSAYIGAAVRAKVSLIEKGAMGGDCLNTGCVPSKALIRTARLVHDIRHAADHGVAEASYRLDFAATMERVQSVIAKVEPHDSPERYRGLGVDVIEGAARIVSPWAVEVNGRTLTTRGIVVATGASPSVPPIPGLVDVPYRSSENLWEMREQPRRLVVLGGGPIGSELTQAFARLGSEVWQVERGNRIMGREDPDVSSEVERRFAAEGVHVLTGTSAVAVEGADAPDADGGRGVLVAERGGETLRLPFDELVVAVGRTPNVTGFGLEELGVEIDERGTVATDAYLRTSVPSIYAVGDVAGPFQFTHTASHQAWYATVNALFGMFRRFKVDYRVIPWATFTDPEVARVGLNESDAKARGIPYELTVYEIGESDRAIADSADEGFIKVLTVPGRDTILGVTIVGAHAGELIAEYVLAMKRKVGLKRLLGTIHVYPTLAESNKAAAGVWQKAHQPERVLGWLERFHAWRRGGAAPDMPAAVETMAHR